MGQADALSVVPGRSCGTCAMCCKLPAIPELDKPVGTWCAHARSGKGCGIYDTRPAMCRAFFCMWMLDRTFGPEWKPDRAKLYLHRQANGVNLQVSVDANFPNAWTKEPYYSWIKRAARDGAGQGRFVFVRIGPRLIAVLPDRDEDMGTVAFDDDVVVSRRMTPAGPDYLVEVMRHAPAAS